MRRLLRALSLLRLRCWLAGEHVVHAWSDPGIDGHQFSYCARCGLLHQKYAREATP